MAILDEVIRLVAERLEQHNIVRADMYYMADLRSRYEMWEEAWMNGETSLLALFLLVEIGKW